MANKIRKLHNYAQTLSDPAWHEYAKACEAATDEQLQEMRDAAEQSRAELHEITLERRAELRDAERDHDEEVDRLTIIEREMLRRVDRFQRGDTVVDEFGVVYRVTRSELRIARDGTTSLDYYGIRLSKTGIEQNGERPLLSPHLKPYETED